MIFFNKEGSDNLGIFNIFNKSNKSNEQKHVSKENNSSYNFSPEELERQYQEEMEELNEQIKTAATRQEEDKKLFSDIASRIKQSYSAPGAERAADIASEEAKKLQEEIKELEKKKELEKEKRRKQYFGTYDGRCYTTLLLYMNIGSEKIDEILNNQKEIVLDLPNLSGTFTLTKKDLTLPFLQNQQALEISDEKDDKKIEDALKRCNGSSDNLKYITGCIINLEKEFFKSVEPEKENKEKSSKVPGEKVDTTASVKTDKIEEKPEDRVIIEDDEYPLTEADFRYYPSETTHKKR